MTLRPVARRAVQVVELVLQQLGEGLRHARPLFALPVLVGELHGQAGMALYSAEQPRQRHAVIKQREFVIGGPGDVWVAQHTGVGPEFRDALTHVDGDKPALHLDLRGGDPAPKPILLAELLQRSPTNGVDSA